MDRLKSHRKRKRPSYLVDFYDTMCDEEATTPKKKAFTNEDSNKDCTLCGNTAKTPGNTWNLVSRTGASKFKCSDVLNKLFKDAQLPPSVTKHDFSGGFLCPDCKDHVGDLDLMQHKVIGEKKLIMSLFKSKLSDMKINYKSSPLETSIEKNKNSKDDVYIIESLREKKGNNFLVKWENYPEEENTWEPRKSIPAFIMKFYDKDLSRLGMPTPPLPLVKQRKNYLNILCSLLKYSTVRVNF